MTATLTALPAGPHGLLSARPEPDLAALGYEETEHVVTGTATSYTSDHWPADGRLAVTPGATADFATRVVVRLPPPERASGTLVVEWFNVSSGADACPDWTFAAPEILRAGHAWAGVSAQRTGVEGGTATVAVDGAPSAGIKGTDPERYGALHHPGDAFAHDLFTQVAAAVRDLIGAERVLAMGESQSAALLTTYVNGIHPLARLFDGFLLHSRLGVAAPLGEPGAGIDLNAALATGPVRLRDDLAEPVLVVQTEGDLFDRVGYLPARQPDGERLRVWEVAGAAHADRYTIDQFEELLGCAVPVNRGQQWAVVRAALRALDRWVRDGVARARRRAAGGRAATTSCATGTAWRSGACARRWWTHRSRCCPAGRGRAPRWRAACSAAPPRSTRRPGPRPRSTWRPTSAPRTTRSAPGSCSPTTAPTCSPRPGRTSCPRWKEIDDGPREDAAPLPVR